MVFYAVFPLLFLRYRNGPSLVALFFAALLIAVAFHEFVLHLALPRRCRGTYYNFSFFRHLPVLSSGCCAGSYSIATSTAASIAPGSAPL